jgi:hypothetical protein
LKNTLKHTPTFIPDSKSMSKSAILHSFDAEVAETFLNGI